MLTEEIKNYYEREIAVMKSLDWVEIDRAVRAIIDAYEREATIYVLGNGGSAATASHFANDFNKGISGQFDKKFHMVCLCDNFATVMAIANDINYDEVFRFQLQGRLKRDDLIIGISGSGNSINVINAVQYAKEIGTPIVGVSGYTGGKLKELADYNFHASIEDMQITEDLHMTFDHMMYRVISEYLEKREKRIEE